jgi:hypothetical protein
MADAHTRTGRAMTTTGPITATGTLGLGSEGGTSWDDFGL